MTENAVIQKCREEEISQIGQFYDSVIQWLDDHVNYPKLYFANLTTVVSVFAGTVGHDPKIKQKETEEKHGTQ